MNCYFRQAKKPAPDGGRDIVGILRVHAQSDRDGFTSARSGPAMGRFRLYGGRVFDMSRVPMKLISLRPST
jgi:hypothetical protein